MTHVKVWLTTILIGVVLLGAMGLASAQPIGASPQALAFVYQAGGPNPGAQTLIVTASVPTSFTVTTSGAPWLTVSPTSGVTPASIIVTLTAPPNATPG